MPKCASCGEENKLGLLFCNHCGEEITLATEEVYKDAEAEAREKATLRMERQGYQFLVGAVFLLVGAIVFKMLNREKDLPTFRDVPSLRPLVWYEVTHLEIPVHGVQFPVLPGAQ